MSISQNKMKIKFKKPPLKYTKGPHKIIVKDPKNERKSAKTGRKTGKRQQKQQQQQPQQVFAGETF